MILWALPLGPDGLRKLHRLGRISEIFMCVPLKTKLAEIIREMDREAAVNDAQTHNCGVDRKYGGGLWG